MIFYIITILKYCCLGSGLVLYDVLYIILQREPILRLEGKFWPDPVHPRGQPAD